MKNMKIRVNEANRQEVKAALLALGYGRNGRMDDLAIYDTTKHYLTYGNGLVMCTGGDDEENEKHFLSHANEEHVLFNGEFKPLSYFQQPKTPEQKPVEPFPVRLRSRADNERARMLDIVQAMAVALKENLDIPEDWQEELNEIFWKQNHRKQFVKVNMEEME